MKFFFTILFFVSFSANATNYYVSNTGSDAAAGTSTGTAWQTIAKVNAQTFAPGDSILFKRGDSWNERLNPPSSGTNAARIYFDAYGTGNMPQLTGLQTVSSPSISGNVYTYTATNSVKQQNTVLVNGTIQRKARTPNTGWSTFTTTPANNQIGGTGLSGTPNYTGSQVVIRDAHWIIDVCTITAQVTSTLTFNPATTYGTSAGALGGSGFFIQNTPSDLDQVGEWTYDSTSKALKVYATSTPSVTMSTIDTLVYIHNKNYLTFKHINFNGANKAGFRLDTANHITIDSCLLNYMGWRGITGIHSHWVRVTYDSIQNCFSNAIYLRQDDPYTPTVNTCDSSVIKYNYIHNSGAVAGMGENDNGHYIGISAIGDIDSITNNQVDSSGYIGINWAGKKNWLYQNYVTTYGYIKDDGGGIYSVIGAYLTTAFSDSSEVRSNICRHGIGAPAGTSNVSVEAGIYYDDLMRQQKCDSNTIEDNYIYGFHINGENHCSFYDNTSIDSLGHCAFVNYAFDPVNNLSFHRNIYYSQNASMECFWLGASDLTESIDSNYYLRPTSEGGKWQMAAVTYSSLPAWTSATTYDLHGHVTPTGLTGALPTIVYNPSTTTLNYNLTFTAQDPKGIGYAPGTVTIRPFGSIILFPSYSLPGLIISNIKYRLR